MSARNARTASASRPRLPASESRTTPPILPTSISPIMLIEPSQAYLRRARPATCRNLRKAAVPPLLAILLAACAGSTPVNPLAHAKVITTASGSVCQRLPDRKLVGCVPPPTTTTTAASAPKPAVMPCSLAVTQPTQTRCAEKSGQTIALAHGTQPLRLKTLTAQIVGVRTAGSVSSGDGAVSATATGVFLIVTLRVVNRTDAPQTFDGIGAAQVALGLNGATYTESFQAENQADQQSFISQSTPIQPGESQTGAVVFDVPPARARTLRAPDDVLLVCDFGQSFSSSVPPGAGMISLGGA